MLEIKEGDRISFENEYGGRSDAYVLHKFWLFGWRLRIVTYNSQEYITISAKRVISILERNAIGK